MDEEYYKITSEIDAREVLRYLNNLGIHNISGEVLKYFITDLKKYIKYDLERRHNHSSRSERTEEVQGPERLHSASTFSSRIRSKAYDGGVVKCFKECQKTRKPLNVLNVQSAPNIGQKKLEENIDKPLRRACSCVRIEKKTETIGQTKSATTTSSNLIKVAKQPTIKKCDPVSLYQYYCDMWEKYKPNVPGENNWSELRWSVRQKMAGNVHKQTSTKIVPPLQLRTRENVVPKD